MVRPYYRAYYFMTLSGLDAGLVTRIITSQLQGRQSASEHTPVDNFVFSDMAQIGIAEIRLEQQNNSAPNPRSQATPSSQPKLLNEQKRAVLLPPLPPLREGGREAQDPRFLA
jgi:hypothetical protein